MNIYVFTISLYLLLCAVISWISYKTDPSSKLEGYNTSRYRVAHFLWSLLMWPFYLMAIACRCADNPIKWLFLAWLLPSILIATLLLQLDITWLDGEVWGAFLIAGAMTAGFWVLNVLVIIADTKSARFARFGDIMSHI